MPLYRHIDASTWLTLRTIEQTRQETLTPATNSTFPKSALFIGDNVSDYESKKRDLSSKTYVVGFQVICWWKPNPWSAMIFRLHRLLRLAIGWALRIRKSLTRRFFDFWSVSVEGEMHVYRNVLPDPLPTKLVVFAWWWPQLSSSGLNSSIVFTSSWPENTLCNAQPSARLGVSIAYLSYSLSTGDGGIYNEKVQLASE